MQNRKQLDAHMLHKAKDLNQHHIRCYLCHGIFGIRSLAPTRDHVRPKSDKSQKKNNLRWAHAGCNQEKANMPLIYYRMYKIFLGTLTQEMAQRFKHKEITI